MNHPILKNEDDASSKYEVEASVRELSTMLGERVSNFAYPNGIPGMDFDDREVRLLAASGIRMGFTTEARSLHQEDDRLRIPRIAVSDRERVGSMRAKLLLGAGWNRLKTVARRGEYLERLRLGRALLDSRAQAAATSNTSL